MRMPSRRQLRSLERATTVYEKELELALAYLTGRGISLETAREARLGVVTSPDPGHEHAKGRLSIPYMNKVGVIGLKFRCLIEHDCKAEGCPKYIIPNGQETYVYGVLDADADADTLHVTEGETDRLILKQVLGEPVIGWPGASVWEPHHGWHFRGWARVLGWPDGDKAGQDMARKFQKHVQNFESVPMPSGHDVNSLFLEMGAEAIRRLAGMEDEE